ncbi:unnamed protein product [Sphagnum jensenii]|uniref:Uncharacterized protein n=1 Tax=Sphagnum jensenii TaxID=128206 RepID=A0ABP1B011_9BRYO
MSVAQAKRRRLSELPSNPAFSNTTTICASRQQNSSTECDDCEICERNGLGGRRSDATDKKKTKQFYVRRKCSANGARELYLAGKFKRSAQRLRGVGLKDTSAGQSSTLLS